MVRNTPRPTFLYPKDWYDRVCYGGGCVTWKIRCDERFEKEKKCDKLKDVKCKYVMTYYHGLHPLWTEHHWIDFVLPNGTEIHADDGTIGGSDHFFQEFDSDIFSPNPRPKR